VSAAPASETDRLVGGRYRLRTQLGRGGAGVVWVAEDELLGREVAVKEFLLPSGVGVEDRAVMLERVLREARAAARLHDPSLVTVFDVVREDEQPWIVMEYVPGRSLAEVVREDGPLSAARAAEIGIALLHALRTAHSNGVLHRDVKPANVLLDEAGRVLLTDFGIAFTEGDPSLTSTGILLGSPAYMAPERARGERATPSSDLWSLGATLYTLVEGEPPYTGENSLAVLSAVADGRRRPMERSGSLAPVLADLLDRPAHERPDVDELDDRLRSAARSTAPPSVTTAVTTATTTAVTRPERVGERTTVLAALPAADASEARAAAATPSPVPAAADARRQPPPVPPRRVEPRRVPPRTAGFDTAEQRRPHRRLAAGLLGAAAAVGALIVAAVVLLGGSGAGSNTRPGSQATATAAPPAGAGLAASPAPSSARPSASPSRSASPSPTPSRSASPTPTPTPSPSPSPSPSGSPAPSRSASSAAVPAGWQTYNNSRYGWTIAHPAGWSAGSGITADQVDLRDPTTGRLLRVEIGVQAHASAINDWYSYEPAFARQVQDYRRIRISPSDGGNGNRSADWEFTFRSGSVTLHALDRGVVDGRTAHALYWQTTESDWPASQQQFEQLAGSFVPPPQG